MKKYVVVVSIMLSAVAVYGQQATNCTINIQFAKGLPVKTDQQVFLTLNGKTDSATVVNGLASFQKQVDKPTQARVMLRRMSNFYSNNEMKWIYADQGTITLTVTDMDSVFKAIAKGPLLTTEYDAQLRLPVDLYNLQTHLLDVAYSKAKKAQSPDTTTLLAQKDASIRACFQVPQTYIKAHPGSSLSIVALNFLGNGSYPMTIGQLESLYNSLDAPVRASEDGLKYADKLQRLKATQAAREAKEAAKQKEG